MHNLEFEDFPRLPDHFRVKLGQRTHHDGSRATALFFTPTPPFTLPARPEVLYMWPGQRGLGAGHAHLVRTWFDRRTPFNLRLPSVQDGVAMFILLAGDPEPGAGRAQG